MTHSLLRSPLCSFHISVSCVCSAGWQKCLRLWGGPMGELFTASENTRSPHLEPSGTSQPGDLPQSVYICTASVFSWGQEDTHRQLFPNLFCLTCTPTSLSVSIEGIVHPQGKLLPSCTQPHVAWMKQKKLIRSFFFFLLLVQYCFRPCSDDPAVRGNNFE